MAGAVGCGRVHAPSHVQCRCRSLIARLSGVQPAAVTSLHTAHVSPVAAAVRGIVQARACSDQLHMCLLLLHVMTQNKCINVCDCSISELSCWLRRFLQRFRQSTLQHRMQGSAAAALLAIWQRPCEP